ncbi:MAG: hypothetical protein IKK38_14440 [Spirochaetaceae bacterium]|nr:hypothetical protein [Spirochaetaceae bacterium]
MKKNVFLIAVVILIIMTVSCSKKSEELQKEQLTTEELHQDEETSAAEVLVSEQIIEQPEITEQEEAEDEVDEDVVFDTSEPSVIPTDGTYFDDVRHYGYLNAVKLILHGAPVPILMLNPKSNVKVRYVYYYDYKNRFQDGTKNISHDVDDLLDPVRICFFDKRKYQGYFEYLEESEINGKIMIFGIKDLPHYYDKPMRKEILDKEKEKCRDPFDIDDLSKWTKTDDGYEMILPPEKYQKEWNSYRLNKLKISSDTITMTYQNIKDLNSLELEDDVILVSQYLFEGDTINYTFHGYRNRSSSNLLDERLVYKKGILTEAYEKESREDKWVWERHYLYSCIEGEGTYEMYEDGNLVAKGKLIREIDEEGFLKKQVILFDDGSAHEFTFSPTSLQKPENSNLEYSTTQNLFQPFF